MEKLRLDGNAAAGLLQEVFAAEVTTALGTCDGCGAVEAVGAVHLYSAAGTVLRCPHCEAVLMKIVSAGGRIWVDLRGLRRLELRS
jgi:ribosomal protein S27E